VNNRQIIVPLITRTGLHIGSGSGDAVTDAFVRRDAQGQPVIPGTSLAGALRTLATRLAPRLELSSVRSVCKVLADDDNADNQPCGCVVCKLFGDVNPLELGTREQREGAETAAAARLWVYDAYPPGTPAAWIRDGVGIGRADGVAYRRGQVKFDMEVLPPGTKFELRLELQSTTDTAQAEAEEQLLAAVLSEWRAGRGAIGGRASRGLGAIQIQEPLPVVYHKFELGDKDHLFAYLSKDDPWAEAENLPDWLDKRLGAVQVSDAAAPEGAARSWLRLTAQIQATGPFLINNPVSAAESSFDHAPLLAGGDREKPLLPGSSLKGVLRSQAERIARTLVTFSTWEQHPQAERKDVFLHRCPACSPVVGEADEPLASCDALLRKHAVVETIQDVNDKQLCLGCRLFGSTRRGSRLRVEDAILVGKPVYKPRDFLAIDRFTGGGADQFKFDAAVLWQPRFEANLFLENPEPWELGWLLLALRDIHEGLAPLGFGSAKGFGVVRAEQWKAELGYLTKQDAKRLELPADGNTKPNGLYQVLRVSSEDVEGWREVAQGWVHAFLNEVNGFERDSDGERKILPALAADHYFGAGIEKLYPVKEALDG
jgi:CRISPR-associated RAMP protein (TIGR02581 family)